MQSAGILISTIATGSDMKTLVWVGIGFNCVASLIAIFEKHNTTISRKLLHDIESIKNHTYVDESVLDSDVDNVQPKPTQASIART